MFNNSKQYFVFLVQCVTKNSLSSTLGKQNKSERNLALLGAKLLYELGTSTFSLYDHSSSTRSQRTSSVVGFGRHSSLHTTLRTHTYAATARDRGARAAATMKLYLVLFLRIAVRSEVAKLPLSALAHGVR